MSKSVDLREAAVAYQKAGHTYDETAEVFGVVKSTVHRWVKKYNEMGDLSNKPLNRNFKKIDPEKLKLYVSEHPDAYQNEIAKIFNCTNQSISKAFKRHGITRKKKALTYKEQDAKKVEEYLEKIKDIPKEKICYVDETGIDTCLCREYGYALRGEKVHGKISGKKFQRTNIVAALLNNEIIAPLQYKFTTDNTLFEFWFEKCLLPCLDEDVIIVMDNASFHRKEKLTKLALQKNISNIFLPPYSPELNPIEKYWAALKHKIKENLRNSVSLDEAIHLAFS